MKCTYVMQKPAGTNAKKKGVNHTSSTTTNPTASSTRLTVARPSKITIPVVAVGNNTNQFAH
jgi:hypothetical protein